MPQVLFATSNQDKLALAKTICSNFGIKVKQVICEIDEIQGEDGRLIVQDKVRRAYQILAKPVIVSDDSWNIPVLNGFPGPYMKSINEWFTAEDFLRLMNGLSDRTIIIDQFLAYYDGQTIKIFHSSLSGKVIDQPRGTNDRSPSTTITVLDGDHNLTMAEVFNQGRSAIAKLYLTRRGVWHDFIDWYSL